MNNETRLEESILTALVYGLGYSDYYELIDGTRVRGITESHLKEYLYEHGWRRISDLQLCDFARIAGLKETKGFVIIGTTTTKRTARILTIN